MPYVSKHRFARITARKVRLMTDLIQNKAVGEALDLLKFNKKRAAIFVTKVLQSAIANADTKEADVENLYVQAAFCDDGPIMKRFMPKDRGKSFSIFKRTCHITVAVEEGTAPDRKKDRKAKGAAKVKAREAKAGKATAKKVVAETK